MGLLLALGNEGAARTLDRQVSEDHYFVGGGWFSMQIQTIATASGQGMRPRPHPRSWSCKCTASRCSRAGAHSGCSEITRATSAVVHRERAISVRQSTQRISMDLASATHL